MAQAFAWRDGERVLFIGDSVTEDPQGFVRLIPALVTARYPELAIDYTQRGVGGNRIGDLLGRLEHEVLRADTRPTWIGVSIGLNDVQHGAAGTPLGRFRDLYRVLLLLLEETDATIACLTTTVIGEELDNPRNAALAGYNEAIRAIAFEHGARMIDINAIFHDTLRRAQSRNPNLRFTIDGMHLNIIGHYLVALGVLDSLHFALPTVEYGSPGGEIPFDRAA